MPNQACHAFWQYKLPIDFRAYDLCPAVGVFSYMKSSIAPPSSSIIPADQAKLSWIHSTPLQY